MQNLKIVSIPRLKVEAGGREFSLFGGHLYLDGEPVQSYFSKDMFYWEKDGEKGSVFLRHYGLMAEIVIIKNGVKEMYTAAADLHYDIAYHRDGKSEPAKLDVGFGVSVDTKGETHYYCSLVCDQKSVIPAPITDEEKRNQRFMKVMITEKELLRIVIDLSAYQSVHKDFPIVSIDMVFDAAYNTCDALITEGISHVTEYEPSKIKMDLTEMTEEEKVKGSATVLYTDEEKKAHEIKINIDSITADGKPHYYGGITHNGKEVIALPLTEKAKKSQEFLSCMKIDAGWLITVNKCPTFPEKGFYASSMNLWGESAGISKIYEDKSVKNVYKATGKIKLTGEIENRSKIFKADKEAAAGLKARCTENGLINAPLSVDELYSLSPPPSYEITDKSDPSKKVILDGQAYCHFKSAEILSYLAAYYTADTGCSDKTIKYADLYGYTKEKAKSEVTQVSPAIIGEIESRRDETGSQYIVEFLKKYSNIILASSYAGSPNEYIQKGFEGVNDPVLRCQCYLSDEGKKALQSEKGYQAAINIIDRHVYISLVPKLAQYVSDAGRNWAEELYYSAAEKIVMLKLQSTESKNKGTHISKMLSILDTKKHVLKESINGKPLKDDKGNKIEMPYGAALYAQIFNLSLAEIGNNFKGADDLSDYLKIMRIFFGDLYDKLQAGKISDIPPDILEELNKFLAMTREAFVQHQIVLMVDMLQFAALAGDIMRAMTLKGKSSSNFVCCMVYAFIGMSFGGVLFNWNNLSTAQKAEAFTGIALSVIGAARGALTWRSISTLLNSSSEADIIQAAFRLKYGGASFEKIQNAIPAKSGVTLSEALQETSEQYAMSIKSPSGAAVSMSKMTKLFVALEIAFQIVCIALMAFAFIMATIELVDMFEQGTYDDLTKILSVINTVILGVSLVAGVAAFILSFTALAASFAAASVLPGIGIVCMVGLLIVTVLLFIFHKTPKPPIQIFIEERLRDTVKNLPLPSDEWRKKFKPEKSEMIVYA